MYTIEFYAAERKKELIPFATAWMELTVLLFEIRGLCVKPNASLHMILCLDSLTHSFMQCYSRENFTPATSNPASTLHVATGEFILLEVS